MISDVKKEVLCTFTQDELGSVTEVQVRVVSGYIDSVSTIRDGHIEVIRPSTLKVILSNHELIMSELDAAIEITK